jgi:hypothetical protein
MRPRVQASVLPPTPNFLSKFLKRTFSSSLLKSELKIQNKIQKKAWWRTPIIPVLERLRQEDCKLQDSKGYTSSKSV